MSQEIRKSLKYNNFGVGDRFLYTPPMMKNLEVL